MTSKFNPMRRHHEHCRHVRAQMSDYLDGELDPTTTSTVDRHTRFCPNCRRMLANLTRTVAGLGALRSLDERDDDVRLE